MGIRYWEILAPNNKLFRNTQKRKEQLGPVGTTNNLRRLAAQVVMKVDLLDVTPRGVRPRRRPTFIYNYIAYSILCQL